MPSPRVVGLFGRFTKAQLLDAIYTACHLGTDESDEQIGVQMARNIQAALYDRGEHIPKWLATEAEKRIDSDPGGDA